MATNSTLNMQLWKYMVNNFGYKIHEDFFMAYGTGRVQFKSVMFEDWLNPYIFKDFVFPFYPTNDKSSVGGVDFKTCEIDGFDMDLLTILHKLRV